jgi:hypothetical protein
VLGQAPVTPGECLPSDFTDDSRNSVTGGGGGGGTTTSTGGGSSARPWRLPRQRHDIFGHHRSDAGADAGSSAPTTSG